MLLRDLTFVDWIEHAFSHEVRFGRPQWFFDEDCPWWDPQPAEAVAHIARLFADPVTALAGFGDEQIAQGLTYLFNISATGGKDWLSDTSTPIATRLACVRSIFTLFEKLFAPRCSPDLAFMSATPGAPLNTVCYMWWDEFIAIANPGDPHFDTLHEAALEVMARSLRLPAVSCQEAALHGLGHWHLQFPAHTEKIIDAYLGETSPIDPDLQRYARSARAGCVL